MRRVHALLLAAGLGLLVAGAAAPALAEQKGGPVTDNDSRKTNCRSAGGTVSETSGTTFTCTLRGDTGTATVSCTDGGGCSCSGSACDEFGGDDALARLTPGTGTRPMLELQQAPQKLQWQAVQKQPAAIEGTRRVNAGRVQIQPGYAAQPVSESQVRIVGGGSQPGVGGRVKGEYKCSCTGKKATGKCTTARDANSLECYADGSDPCTGTCSLTITTTGVVAH